MGVVLGVLYPVFCLRVESGFERALVSLRSVCLVGTSAAVRAIRQTQCEAVRMVLQVMVADRDHQVQTVNVFTL